MSEGMNEIDKAKAVLAQLDPEQWPNLVIAMDDFVKKSASPHPEAREEEIAEVHRLIEDAQDLIQPERVIPRDDQAWHQLEKAKDTLSRLAAQKDEGWDEREKEYQRLVDGGPCGLMERPDVEPNGCRAVFDTEKCKGCGFYPVAPEPRPAEEAMPEAIAAADMINDAIDRARIPGDGAGLYTRILSIVDEALRSQLARKDEALKKALAYLPEHLRHLRAKNDPKALSLTNDLAGIRAALREPDGRKGE